MTVTRDKNMVDELNLIQMQVQRMANNSFMIKGWYVTILIAIISITTNEQRLEYIYLGMIFVLFVALYDCYFLMLERKYRDKYNWVVGKIPTDNTPMDNKELFNLNPYSTKHFISGNELKWVGDVKDKLMPNFASDLTDEEKKKEKLKEWGRFLVDFLLAFFSKPIIFFYWVPVIYLIILA